MPRSARFLPDKVFYHVISRGNQKQKVFLHDLDYRCYLKMVRKYKKKFAVDVYGFCLMPNHVHFVLRFTESRYLSLFMQGLNQSYTIYFNAKYKKCGHLWQGRFKSMIISNEGYLLDCVEYVEFNPVRAELVKSASEYPWSSYRYRILDTKDHISDLPFSIKQLGSET